MSSTHSAPIADSQPGAQPTILVAGASLAVPRRANPIPVSRPPFYAVGLTPGITFTLGGLSTDGDARVLDRSGQPIPGLYAVGADAGGIHNEQYAGGLCLGLVFGRRAAQHAVAAVRVRFKFGEKG